MPCVRWAAVLTEDDAAERKAAPWYRENGISGFNEGEDRQHTAAVLPSGHCRSFLQGCLPPPCIISVHAFCVRWETLPCPFFSWGYRPHSISAWIFCLWRGLILESRPRRQRPLSRNMYPASASGSGWQSRSDGGWRIWWERCFC